MALGESEKSNSAVSAVHSQEQGTPRLGLRSKWGGSAECFWLGSIFWVSHGFHSDQSQTAGRGLVSIWCSRLSLQAFAYYTQEIHQKPKLLKPAG